MATILVVFESRHGHAADVAEHVGESARDRGLLATILHVDVARRADLARYEGVVVVAPLYYGDYPHSVADFLRARRTELGCRPRAFVSVGNISASADPAVKAKGPRAIRRLEAKTDLPFDISVAVAGALAYPRYGILKRIFTWVSASCAGLPTDTSMVHDLTDWNALDRALAPFLDSFVAPAEDDGDEHSGIHLRHALATAGSR